MTFIQHFPGDSRKSNCSETPPASADIVVVGGGISGLTTAYRLKRLGWHVQVIEAAGCPGGTIASRREQGYLWEAGPNSALNTAPMVDELIDELGIAEQCLRVNSNANKRYVVRSDQLMPVPQNPRALFNTRLFGLQTKLSVLFEPFVTPINSDQEESVSQFVTRRLCREFLDYAIEPFVAGIYAGNPDVLSLPAAFPRLFSAEQHYRSLIRAQILGARERARDKNISKDRAASFSFRDGMQTLTDALAGRLPLQLDALVTSLNRNPNGSIAVTSRLGKSLHTCHARAVVLATPAKESSALIAPLAPDAAAALDEIPYAPIAVVINAWRLADLGHALDGFGFLVPRIEYRQILGALFSSSMFTGRAPAGYALLTTFIGGMRQPDLLQSDDETLKQIAQTELASLLAARGAPVWQQLVRHSRSIPQYTLGHLDRVRRADGINEVMPNLFFCANWRGGVAMADCIKSAYAMAGKVDVWLKSHQTVHPGTA